MANESMLTSLLRGPDGSAQSFLEGIFNPMVQYDEVTNAIFSQLSNDDHNALRRTNSTMNNSLMALRHDGTLKHRLEALRDTCDVFEASFGNPRHIHTDWQMCRNGLNSSARLSRCSRQENEPGFDKDWETCHNFKKEFLVCTRCERWIRLRIYDDNRVSTWECRIHWPVCQVCRERQERKHPQGAKLCECVAKLKRRLLCEMCLVARRNWMVNDVRRKKTMRDTIWRDNNGEVKFDHEPRFTSSRCFGCGVGEVAENLFSYDYYDPRSGPKICLHCREYYIAPTREVKVTPPVRKSPRLNPSDTSFVGHIRLSYHGPVGWVTTEPQGPHGFWSGEE